MHTRPRLITFRAKVITIAVDRGFGILRHVIWRKTEHFSFITKTGRPVVTTLIWVNFVWHIEIDIIRVRRNDFVAFVGPIIDCIRTAPEQGVPEVDADTLGRKVFRVFGIFQAILPRLHSFNAMGVNQLAHFNGEVAGKMLDVLNLALFDHVLTDLRFGPWLIFNTLINNAFTRFNWTVLILETRTQPDIFCLIATEVPSR
ncbi:Uncharacterised protein [Yersinia massiliensis]|nr:Uncharacterised protein [Yersinia massiliensis]